MSTLVSHTHAQLRAEVGALEGKLKRLSDLDLFILDNSIRESSVAQTRSHTVEDKKGIYYLCKKCGMHSIIVASLSHRYGVDDEFCQWLHDAGEDTSKLFSFSEVSSGTIVHGRYDTSTVPVALLKNRSYGIYNIIFEVDLADRNISWGIKWTVADMCQLIDKWIHWVYTYMNQAARIILNFRDLPAAFTAAPDRILSVAEHVAKMPKDVRIFGLAFEDPTGDTMPERLAAWTRALRSIMDSCGWESGHLLNHVHEKWELRMAATLECLAAGSDGIWASLCTEGSPMGHASSTVTLTNLVRLGNSKVSERYNCTEFSRAAVEVTRLTTRGMPDPKQCVYGERALMPAFCQAEISDAMESDLPREGIAGRIARWKYRRWHLNG